ncbi:MAG TPA: hypothetical protein VMN58_12735, partial [Acidimicrobiales bacterium]|nr:hypothetical protein [Acidimicrobiales bacterium]
RPWARTGEVSTATVTVLGPNGKVRRAVDATLQDGRWVAATRLKKSETALVARGAVVDTWGEINGEALATTGLAMPVDVPPSVGSASVSSPVGPAVLAQERTAASIAGDLARGAGAGALLIALAAAAATGLRRRRS